jgi:hypothetical protein
LKKKDKWGWFRLDLHNKSKYNIMVFGALNKALGTIIFVQAIIFFACLCQIYQGKIMKEKDRMVNIIKI